jgi:hypothetical protein
MTMKSGVARATYDDVNLILRLYELRREERLRQARRWFRESFKVKTLEEFQALCPPGSEQNEYYRMVSSHWEMVASFLTSEVVNQELFFQSGRELLLVWVRVRGFLPALREAYGHPAELRNLEVAARDFIQWWNELTPGAFDAFAKRVGG